MSVEIELDLDADGVADGITTVAGALETLEESGDMDFNLKDVDVDEITGKIGDITKELDNLDFNWDFSELDKRLDKIEELEGSEMEIKANVDMPSGNTGDGDSTGNDPPTDSSSARKKIMARAKSGEGDGDFNPREVSTKLEDLLGFDRGQVKIFDNVDTSALDDAAADLHRITNEAWEPNKSDGNLAGNQVPDSLFNEGRQVAVDTEDGLLPWKTAMVKKQGGYGEGYLSETKSQTVSTLERGSDYTTVGGEEKQLSDTVKQLADEYAQEKAKAVNAALDEESQNAILDNIDRKSNDFADINADTLGSGDNPSVSDIKHQMRMNKAAGLSRVPGAEKLDSDGTSAVDFYSNLTPEKKSGIIGSTSEIPDGKFSDPRRSRLSKLPFSMDEFGKGFGKIERKLGQFKPTMGKYMQFFAALIPIALALGTQLLGVAAAMGSVAAAGGAMIGLGLLGHAESFSGSVAEAKQQVKDLKMELFNTFQPAMQQFAPIQSRAFDAIPSGLSGVSEEIENLGQFEETLFSLGGALAGGMEEAVAIVNENGAAISQLSQRFGGLVGSGLLKFFEWLIQAASRNQNLLVGLGRDMVKLAVAAYNFSMAIAAVISNLSPLFDFIVFLSQALRSNLIVQLVTLISLLYIFGKTAMIIYSVGKAFAALAGGIKFAVGIMSVYTLSTWQAYAATAALVGLLTGGLALLGGALGFGMAKSQIPNTGGGSGSYGGGGTYNDNRSYTINANGDMDYADRKSVEGTIREVDSTKKARKLPDL